MGSAGYFSPVHSPSNPDIQAFGAAVSQKALIPTIENSLQADQYADATSRANEPAAKILRNNVPGIFGVAGTLAILLLTLYFFFRYLV
jgi:hypothetical protein